MKKITRKQSLEFVKDKNCSFGEAFHKVTGESCGWLVQYRYKSTVVKTEKYDTEFEARANATFWVQNPESLTLH